MAQTHKGDDIRRHSPRILYLFPSLMLFLTLPDFPQVLSLLYPVNSLSCLVMLSDTVCVSPVLPDLHLQPWTLWPYPLSLP